MPSKSRPRENTVESYLCELCESRGWLCYKLACIGTNGFPDRTIITDTGMIVFCEVKRPGEKPRKLQIRRMRELKRNKVNVCATDSREGVDKLVSALDIGKMPKNLDKNTFMVL